MTNVQFDNEKKYMATMMMARNLLEQGIISEPEYRRIDTKYHKKYNVSLATLFADIDLIKTCNYENM